MRRETNCRTRAIVFDKDGVLLDFNHRWLQVGEARLDTLTHEGALNPDDRDMLARRLGYPEDRVDPVGPLALGSRADEAAIAAGFLYERGIPWPEARLAVERAFDEAERALSREATLRATCDLAGCLAELQEKGLLLAVATSDSTENARLDLEALGVLDRFEAVVGADAVARNKPFPDMLEALSAALGISCAEMAMVGDGLSDMRMARAAGSFAIGVLSGVSHHAILAPVADRVIAGIWELRAAL